MQTSWIPWNVRVLSKLCGSAEQVLWWTNCPLTGKAHDIQVNLAWMTFEIWWSFLQKILPSRWIFKSTVQCNPFIILSSYISEWAKQVQLNLVITNLMEPRRNFEISECSIYWGSNTYRKCGWYFQLRHILGIRDINVRGIKVQLYIHCDKTCIQSGNQLNIRKRQCFYLNCKTLWIRQLCYVLFCTSVKFVVR